MLATTEIKMDAGVAAFWPGRELVVSSKGNHCESDVFSGAVDAMNNE
jgi:hypothetical protein